MILLKKQIVWLGKMMPFIFCFIVLIGLIETLYAYINCSYCILQDGSACLYKPITWFLGRYLKYDLGTIFIMLSLTYYLKNCLRNKIAIYYLLANLIQKGVIENSKFNLNYIYFYVGINSLFILCILFSGIQQGIKNIRCRKKKYFKS